MSRDVGSVSNLEGHDTSRALLLKKKGVFSKNKKGTSLFIAKSWGHVPLVPPVPTSMWISTLYQIFLISRENFCH